MIKRVSGVLWMLLSLVGLYFLFGAANAQVEAHPTMDTFIQWGVFVIIFVPICCGLFLFGWYAIRGEYEE